MKFHYMAHDNQSKSMKKLWPGKLSNFNWKRKMEETNWSSDFYSDMQSGFHIQSWNQSFFCFGIYFLR